MKIRKVLIANRGEIALRIIRALRELDIEPVLVYAYEDRDALPTQLAKTKICIGKGGVKDSYLNIPNIISAATLLKVDAIHPGYGFLSENPMFARIVEDHGIKFIGPTPEAMQQLKNKANVRKIASSIGIPILPGTTEPIENLDIAKKVAKEIGYPIMLKAATGGGGKGIRVVNNEEELVRLFPIAKSEAKASFGKDAIYIEKYLENPRHIEVQIAGDEYGNVYAVGTRECSIQRNHQKVIEEAPAQLKESETLKIMEDAIKFAKAIKYTNLGTVEFLYLNGQHYLMEMNARIQVEHPVTEETTGLDLVKMQIQIAQGEKILLKDIKTTTHAIEFRINAEDPFDNFKPSFGKISNLHLPLGRNVRIDSHIFEGYTVPPFFDSLLAKFIIKGNTREEALKTAKRVFEEVRIEGIKTNIPLHRKLLETEEFTKNKVHTKFLEEFLKEIKLV
ncbi:acetyl/propionyl/methylcrotonyl-CoA carboxylase subunit alpha [Caldisericum sp. AR60]|uniref:acetyl-CoA carboxylase biotin carboxylase subunit n=1 Tax=Caldisericum sp. AR60 TaxID=3397852 RepID=UPI0039FC2DC2